jgi:methylated-DNA-protein-cysteine methyltransferase-like protein
LYQRIYRTVRRIPAGRVASYGQIARVTGRCSARQVGYALFALPGDSDVPWQRVINSEGRISVRGGSDSHRMQRWLLEAEGIRFAGDRVDLRLFGWQPDALAVPRGGDLFDD